MLHHSVDTPIGGIPTGGQQDKSQKAYGWGPGLDGYPNYGTKKLVELTQ